MKSQDTSVNQSLAMSAIKKNLKLAIAITLMTALWKYIITKQIM